MLNKERVSRIFERTDIDQLLVCEPMAIYYLTGKKFFPGERFLGVLLRRDKEAILYVNALFRFEEDLGIYKQYFTDTDDIVGLLSKEVDANKTLGVDKCLTANFLLPMMERKIASSFVNGSLPVDLTRAVKDSHEIELMRKSSQINDAAMAEFKKLVHEGVTEIEIANQMLDIYKNLGAEGYSFDPIVAFGDNAADPP